ncbi:MAG: KTSC domain-containing protein [Chlorobi bacterium]|nr:KTSC domain-containing protein [Chlorobiota bacterium]
MDTIKTTSATIKGYDYNGPNEVLDILTCDGTIYRYFDVPLKIFKGLLEGNDPGGYYQKNIRKKFRRLFKAYDFG